MPDDPIPLPKPLALKDNSINYLSKIIHNYLFIERNYPELKLKELDIEGGLCESFSQEVLLAEVLKDQPLTAVERADPATLLRDNEAYQIHCQNLLIAWHNDHTTVTAAQKQEIDEYLDKSLPLSYHLNTLLTRPHGKFFIEAFFKDQQGKILTLTQGDIVYAAVNDIVTYNENNEPINVDVNKFGAIEKLISNLNYNYYAVTFLGHAAALTKKEGEFAYFDPNFNLESATNENTPKIKSKDAGVIARTLLLSAHLAKSFEFAIVEAIPTLQGEPAPHHKNPKPTIVAFDTQGYSNALKLALSYNDATAIETILKRDEKNNPKYDITLIDEDFLGRHLVIATKEVLRVMASDLARAIDINQRDNKGLTLLEKAIGADGIAFVEAVSEYVKKRKINCDINAKNAAGETPLYQAVLLNRKEIVSLLLTFPNIDVNLGDANGISPLLAAALSNNAKMVQLLLDASQIDVNSASPANEWPLLVAVLNNNVDMVEALLKSPKIDVNKTYFGFSILHIALISMNNKIIELLIKNPNISQANKDFASRGLARQENLFFTAASQGRVDILDFSQKNFPAELTGKAVNQPNIDNVSPLLAAVKAGDIQVVEALLKYPGIDVNFADEDGITSLMVAAARLDSKIIKLLLQNPNIPADQREIAQKALDRQENYLFWAASQGQAGIIDFIRDNFPEDITKMMVNQPNIDSVPPLLAAVKTGDIQAVEALLQYPDIDVNLADEDGTSPLMVAAARLDTEIIKLLLQNQNIPDDQREIAQKALDRQENYLFWAASQGQAGIIDFIRESFSAEEAKIVVNKTNVEGVSPLLAAVQADDIQAVEALLKYPDINVTLADKNQRSPLLVAVQNHLSDNNQDRNETNTDMVELILKEKNIPAVEIEASAKIALQLKNEPLFTMLLKHPSAKLSSNELLWLAATTNQHRAVNLLIHHNQFKADVNTQQEGDTLLTSAAKKDHDKVVGALITWTKAVDKLDVNATNAAGETPLTIAVSNGNREIIKYLLLHPHTDVNKSANDKIPLLIAVEKGDADIVKSLIEAGTHLLAKNKWGKTWGNSLLNIALKKGEGKSQANYKEIVKLLVEAHVNTMTPKNTSELLNDIISTLKLSNSPLGSNIPEWKHEITELLTKRIATDSRITLRERINWLAAVSTHPFLKMDEPFYRKLSKTPNEIIIENAINQLKQREQKKPTPGNNPKKPQP